MTNDDIDKLLREAQRLQGIAVEEPGEDEVTCPPGHVAYAWFTTPTNNIVKIVDSKSGQSIKFYRSEVGGLGIVIWFAPPVAMGYYHIIHRSDGTTENAAGWDWAIYREGALPKPMK